MLASTQEEADKITAYMNWQAPDLTGEFVQKVYSENVLGSTHDQPEPRRRSALFSLADVASNLSEQNAGRTLGRHGPLLLRVLIPARVCRSATAAQVWN